MTEMQHLLIPVVHLFHVVEQYVDDLEQKLSGRRQPFVANWQQICKTRRAIVLNSSY